MASDVRIQLEGQLERVERAAQTWEKVARSLQGERWRTGALFPLLDAIAGEVDAAVEEVRRKAGASTEVKAAIVRLQNAQDAVRRGAEAQLRRVGVTPKSTETSGLLAELRAEYPVLHQERLGWRPWHALGITAILFAMFAYEGWMWVHLLPAAGGVIGWYLHWRRSAPVLVTARTLVIRDAAIPLEDVVRVIARIAEVPNRSGKRCELEVYARQRPVLRLSSYGKPDALLAVLKDRGVPCEVDTNWRFWW